MAYTPINWQTGDTITAEKLNKMDNGWSVESSSTTLCEESVTTADNGYGMYAGTLSYSTQITTDTVSVTWNGTEYTCNVTEVDGAYYYGDISAQGPVFTNYPFVIESTPVGNNVYSQTAGTYTIKIASLTETAEVSDDFVTAVNTAIGTPSQLCIESETTTWQTAHDVLVAGGFVYYHASNTSGTIHQIYIAVKSTQYTIVLIGLSTSNNLDIKTFSASSADGVLTAS